ncbi:MAG: hypothetical protein HY000_08810 [Planctomycetes bacterium]|nr:hypothetical protein [Planctomycetota bacterium]
MNKFQVAVSPQDNFCGVRVQGLENGRWLLDHLSRVFIFKSSDPLNEDPGGGTSSFRVSYSSQVSLSLLQKILGAIPQVVLITERPKSV